MQQDQHLLLALLVLDLPLASSFMALAKERAMRNSRSGFVQAQGGPPSLQGAFDPSSHEFFGIKRHYGSIIEGGGCSDPGLGSHLPPLTDPTNSSSRNSFVFGSDHWANSSSSVLSFGRDDRVYSGGHPKLDQGENCASWINNIDHDYQLNYHTESRVVQDENCFEMASNYGSMSDSNKYNRHGEDQFELLYSDDIIVDGLQETGVQVSGSQKHSYMGEHDMQAPKKHCGNGRKSKANPSTSKDPQSLAAKNRRERISERLRILQELVPNGTKVDLVTMLEKAISYVKFLQLQVKVLATDEFWPAQGGKAPEVAQVKEAIDAILASHKR